MISLRVPSGSSPAVSRKSWLKRSSTLMSLFLQHADRAFRAVGRRQPCFLLPAWRNDAVAPDLPIALVVLAEQVRGQVVAAAMPLAAVGVDLQFHGVTPVLWPGPGEAGDHPGEQRSPLLGADRMQVRGYQSAAHREQQAEMRQ